MDIFAPLKTDLPEDQKRNIFILALFHNLLGLDLHESVK